MSSPSSHFKYACNAPRQLNPRDSVPWARPLYVPDHPSDCVVLCVDAYRHCFCDPCTTSPPTECITHHGDRLFKAYSFLLDVRQSDVAGLLGAAPCYDTDRVKLMLMKYLDFPQVARYLIEDAGGTEAFVLTRVEPTDERFIHRTDRRGSVWEMLEQHGDQPAGFESR